VRATSHCIGRAVGLILGLVATGCASPGGGAGWGGTQRTCVIHSFVDVSISASTDTGQLAPLVLLFSLVASGQIKLRGIDGWRKIAAVLRRRTAVAA
jgi:hypothetical protein